VSANQRLHAAPVNHGEPTKVNDHMAKTRFDVAQM